MRTENVQAIIQGIQQILATEEVRAAVARLLADAEQERLATALDHILRKKAYVAVLGAQGTGKSSLLNGLLFTRRILPIGEGATTNVICRIEDSGDGEPRAEVALRSGQTHVEPLELESLEQYMNESHNPGNAKGVRFIQCFARAPLLRANTAFADTPGVGSLLHHHDHEAMSFANDVSLGLFVLRTTPTLTNDEATYLADIWALCPEFVFVQNVWEESVAEVEKSTKDNLAKIRDIAARHGSSDDIILLPVDIHAGLEGMTNGRPDLVEQSGLGLLKTTIDKKIRRDGQAFEVAHRGRQIVAYLRMAIHAGQTEIGTLRNSIGEARQLQLLEAAEQELGTARTRAREHEATFKRRSGELMNVFQSDLTRGINEVRIHYREQVETSGGRSGIEEAFLEQMKQRIAHAGDTFQRGFRDLCDGYIVLAAGQIEDISSALNFNFDEGADIVEDVTGTRIVEKMGTVGAATGVTALTAMTGVSVTAFAGALAQGGTTMAGLAMGFGAVPGAGWAIAAIILTAGVLVRAVARENRKGKLLQSFDKIARDLESQVAEHVIAEATRARDHIVTEVAKEVRAAILQKQEIAANIRSSLSSSEETRKRNETTLKKMITDLDAAAGEIERLVQQVAVAR